MKALIQSLKAPLLGILLAIVVCVILLVAMGETPLVLFQAIQNTIFNGFGLGYTFFYATPLIFTGLSVALCFHCGLFNIGAEGQLYLGAVAVVGVATLFPVHSAWIAIPLAVLAAGILGGLWGAIAGILKAKRGSHEVIVTILLNFIGIALTDYLILYPLKDVNVQNPQTVEIPQSFTFQSLYDFLGHFGLHWFRTTPANTSFFLAILVAILVHLFLFRTTWGFEMRAVGTSPSASRFAGISVARNTILVFFLSGGIAGLVGINEVCGYNHKLIQGFSPEYGFTGIAVALLAENNPLGIVFSALLFGALQNGARELEFLSDKVTKEVSLVLEATLIGFVASRYLLDKFLTKKQAEKLPPPLVNAPTRLEGPDA